MVYQVSQAVNIPVVGLGGIMEGRHAIQFMMAGASAVQVGTAVFTDPLVHLKVIDQIKGFLSASGEDARELTGSLTTG